jgi:hypothetical protein
MKMLSKYFGKLKYVYTERSGCAITLSLFTAYLLGVILWLISANEPNRQLTESDDVKGGLLTGLVILFSLFVAPLLLRNKSKRRENQE